MQATPARQERTAAAYENAGTGEGRELAHGRNVATVDPDLYVRGSGDGGGSWVGWHEFETGLESAALQWGAQGGSSRG